MLVKNRSVIYSSIVAMLFGAVLYFGWSPSCSTRTREWTVSGGSLEGVIENGQEVTAIEGYYRCRTVSRGDIVIYKMPGREQPFIKTVYGAGGDTFHVTPTTEGNIIFINDKPLTTSRGEFYTISDNRLQYLAGYEAKYGGSIPSGQVFLLGNLPNGSVDSIVFGFVLEKNLIAKVIL